MSSFANLDIFKNQIRITFLEGWQKRGVLSYLLWPLSLLTSLYLWLNHHLYTNGLRTREKINRPVIVVGNVVVGGAGKTPIVIELTKYLISSGRSVGVISRGYGREGIGITEVTQELPARICGDEPKLIFTKTHVPVFVGSQKAATARALIEKYPHVDIIISDDGLQHQALARDLNIIIFDNSGIGNGFLLPAGPLREHWPIKYPNCDSELILSTNEGQAPKGFKAQRLLSDYAYNRYGEKIDLRLPLNKKIHALAGIARPESFFLMLEQLGLKLDQTTFLKDHAQIDSSHLDRLIQNSTQSSSDQTLFLCTEKDAVKIWEYTDLVWAVPLNCSLDSRFLDNLEDWLLTLKI